MTDTTPREGPELSVILATDTRDTIRGVLRRLHQQTAKARLEIIIVVPRGQAASFSEGDAQGFGDFHLIEVDDIQPLRKARAIGVRAATAPLVFLAETHAYPRPEWAEAMINAGACADWASITPAFGNANPRGAVSWAAFLIDYGSWAEGTPSGEVDAIPLYNSAYRRSALLELGDRLEVAISHDNELPALFRSRGYRAYLAGDAVVDHLNVANLERLLSSRFLIGRCLGGLRRQRWSWMRRIAYVVASPLIPFALTYRVLVGIRKQPITRSAPAAAFPLIFIGTVASAAGELIGYAKGAPPDAETRADESELHKLGRASEQEV